MTGALLRKRFRLSAPVMAPLKAALERGPEAMLAEVKAGISQDLQGLGLMLTAFMIESITLPPEIQKAIEQAAAQAARGVDNTMAWEGMQAMRDVAANAHRGQGSGAMNAGMGMGMGMGMGNMMGNVMAGAMPGYPPPGYPPGYPPPGYPPPQGYPQQQQQQPGPPPAPAEDNSLESKLRKLKAALDAGLLTEDEYKAKRTKLLDAF